MIFTGLFQRQFLHSGDGGVVQINQLFHQNISNTRQAL